MNSYYLGIDVGSVSTDLVLMDSEMAIRAQVYLRTQGRPLRSIQKGYGQLREQLGQEFEVLGVGTTGSGRRIAAAMAGADVVKNEITAHSVAAVTACPDVRTVMEIGGQDSKIMFIEDGYLRDFAMNTVCAAGTGSFLDRQAERLGMEIGELGQLAARCQDPAPIAGRCAVFAESDMIHSQQEGVAMERIVGGLCQALVRNYLSNLARGRKLRKPIVFQGGVAANQGIVKAFEQELGERLVIPEHYDVMGAWGAAILAKEKMEKKERTAFRGIDADGDDYSVSSFICEQCPNHCQVRAIYCKDRAVGYWGSRCGRYA